MSADGVTFGQAISKARKALGLSQKELATRVMKEEKGGAISPQYLNDVNGGVETCHWGGAKVGHLELRLGA